LGAQQRSLGREARGRSRARCAASTRCERKGRYVVAKLPKPVIDAIFAVTSDILASREVQQKLEAQGLSVSIEPPEVFADRIRRETATWRELIRQRNITAN
jgi:tripartite-type tricarboxylate transporter receptor subunit TctC